MMIPPPDIIRKLSAATPQNYVWQWLLVTMLYSCCILVNEHFELIQALELSQHIQNLIRMAGVLVYIFLTTYSFQKTTDDTHTTTIQGPNHLAADKPHGASVPDTPGNDDVP
ncbi:MAG: hypothetical protein JST82_13770 [Bacteroidetes bacterium]|nr:hypothetical protein [Bacteroidota bacterium]